MRSVISVAGVLAAVGPAMAVPQQYTGYYPQPNGTTTHTPYGTGYYPTSKSTTTYLTTRTTTSTTTSTHTLTVTPSTESQGGNGGGYTPPAQGGTTTVYTTSEAQGTAPGGGQCQGGETVTVTSKEKVTVTVTAGGIEEQSATTKPSHYSFAQQQVTVKHPHSHFHQQHHHHHHSSALPTIIPTEYSAYTNSIPATIPTTTSTPESTYVPPPSTTKKSQPTSTYVAPPSGGGKRGLGYNDAANCDPFEQSGAVSWAYNWGSSPGDLNGDFEYVPLLWGNGDEFTSVWDTNVKEAIANGATEIMGFNEPDIPSQANMDPNTACQAFHTYFDKYAGQVRIGSPSVTNGDPASGLGLGWLGSFMDACSDAPIDFVQVHWYDSASNVEYFKQHITDAHQQTGKPVWVTEFGCTSGSDDEISGFLEDVMGWMDQQDFVEKYAYFMASDGILLSGGALSTIGNTYASG